MTLMGWLRILLSALLSLTGALLVTHLSVGQIGPLLSSVGVALIVAGVVGVFREVVVVRLEAQELAALIARLIRDHFIQVDAQPGLRLVSPTRVDYDEYYRWANRASPRDVFLAGRSILHDIHRDNVAWRSDSGENVLARKLRHGSIIRILFLDPHSDLVDRLAREENQTPEHMLADLATSIGVCWRLHQLLVNPSSLPAGALLQVRLYDEVPYFAYHRDQDLHRKDKDLIIVGFYFTEALGSKSAAYEVHGDQVRSAFEGHFASIFDRAARKTLLEVSRNRCVLDKPLFNQLEQHFVKVLGQDDWQQRLRG